MSTEEKALKACAEMVSARDEVSAISKRIGDALQGCVAANEPEVTGSFDDLNHRSFKTHLARAYEFEVDEEAAYYGGDGRVFNSDDEQAAILAECGYCQAAHKAVQERKAAKKRLAIARRIVTNIGRSVLKERKDA